MKCDGNHGGPRCADPECWHNTLATGCAFNATEPLPYTYPLFKHISNEHGITLIESELHEIMRICKEIETVNWQLIETAPKDGTHVMACNHCCIFIAYNDSGDWFLITGEMIKTPKYWMPLPPLPT